MAERQRFYAAAMKDLRPHQIKAFVKRRIARLYADRLLRLADHRGEMPFTLNGLAEYISVGDSKRPLTRTTALRYLRTLKETGRIWIGEDGQVMVWRSLFSPLSEPVVCIDDDPAGTDLEDWFQYLDARTNDHD